MSITQDLGGSVERFKSSIDALVELFKRHEVDSVSALVQAFRTDDAFSREWKIIWAAIAEADGGKITLATAGTIIGMALGGVGVAAMGGAVGLPLALVLGLGGLVAGSEFDAVRALADNKIRMLKVPRDLHRRIQASARDASMSENDLIVTVLAEAFPEDLD